MKYKNMKIEINESQPRNEIVVELKRLGFYIGFVEDGDTWVSARPETRLIVSFFTAVCLPDPIWTKTTLSELKAMPCQ